MRLSWVPFLMFFSPFLECLHNRKKGHYIWVTSISLMCSLLRRWNPIAEKCSVISTTRFGHFFFRSCTLFHYQRQEKWGEIWWGLKSWLSLLSLKSEVANDIAHRLYGTQSVRIGNIWISEEPLSISKWSYYLFMLFFMLWVQLLTKSILL